MFSSVLYLQQYATCLAVTSYTLTITHRCPDRSSKSDIRQSYCSRPPHATAGTRQPLTAYRPSTQLHTHASEHPTNSACPIHTRTVLLFLSTSPGTACKSWWSCTTAKQRHPYNAVHPHRLVCVPQTPPMHTGSCRTSDSGCMGKRTATSHPLTSPTHANEPACPPQSRHNSAPNYRSACRANTNPHPQSTTQAPPLLVLLKQQQTGAHCFNG